MEQPTNKRGGESAQEAIAFIRRDSAYRLNTLSERITDSVERRIREAGGRWVAPSVAWRDSA